MLQKESFSCGHSLVATSDTLIYKIYNVCRKGISTLFKILVAVFSFLSEVLFVNTITTNDRLRNPRGHHSSNSLQKSKKTLLCKTLFWFKMSLRFESQICIVGFSICGWPRSLDRRKISFLHETQGEQTEAARRQTFKVRPECSCSINNKVNCALLLS